MLRSVWRTPLVLLVQLSWVALAFAQTPPVRSVPIASSHVSLGRPIAVAQPAAVGKPPRPFPLSPGIIPVGYTAEQPVPIATAPRVLETPSPKPWPVEVYDPADGSEFAVDRPATTVRRVILPAGARLPADEIIPAPKTLPPAVTVPGDPPTPPPTPRELRNGRPRDFRERMVDPIEEPPFAGPPSAMPGGLQPPVYLPDLAHGVDGPFPMLSPDGCPTVVLPGEPCCWYDPGHRSWYLKGEYLLWWLNGYQVPPLATTGNQQDFGFLGAPSTQVLFGDSIDTGASSGARFTLGYWCDCDSAFELSGFFVSPGDESALFRGTQFPVLTRPFFSLNRGREFGQLVSFPGEFAGDVSIDSSSDFWGFESNYRCNWCCDCCSDCTGERGYRVDLLLGTRYLGLTEGLAIREDIIGLPTNSIPEFRNQQITVQDSFDTRNRFYGAQVGLDAEWRSGRWSLGARGKLGVGVTQQRISINGSQRLVSLVNGNVQDFQGGLLALNSNIGNHDRDRFSFVPELTLTAGYQMFDHVRIFGGYNVLCWTSVVRPGDQIDRGLDETRIPNFPTGQTPLNVARPAVPFNTSNFWAQGLNFGIELRY